MRSRRPDLAFLGIMILALLLTAGLTWINYNFSLNDPEGIDFVPQWMGARLAIIEGQNPYGEETLKEIQNFIYKGRAAYSWENQYRFVYPYYAIAAFSPMAFTSDYILARAIWMTILAISMVSLTFASLALTRWRPSRVVLAGYVLFALAGYHAFRPVYNGNPAIITALCLTFAFLSIQRGRDILAGILLSFSTIKPQVVLLVLPFVLLWAVSHRRLRLVFSMTVAMLVLVVSSSILQPGWLTENVIQMIEYAKYTGPMTFGSILDERWTEVGSTLGWVLTAILLILMMVEWWGTLGKDVRHFLWTAGLTLAITNMIGIPTSTSNYVVLIPVLTFVFSIWEQRWGVFGRNLVLICMLGLLGGLWWLYMATAGGRSGLDQSLIMFFPLPLFVFFTLYWIRHWAIGSVRLQIEELEALKNL